MSEETIETALSATDELINAIQAKNFNQAERHFTDVLGGKLNDAMEAEKVNVASQIFNDGEPVEEEEDEYAEIDETEEFESQQEEEDLE